MKQFTLSLRSILLLMVLFTACKKEPDVQAPPPPSSQSRSFQFTIASLPGDNQASGALTAVFSIINQKEQVVFSSKAMNLTFQNGYSTALIELPKGSYRVTAFWIVDASGTVRYAAPLAGSARAGEVQNPLTRNFSIPQAQVQSIQIEVLRVASSDQPQQFGYPTGSFGNHSQPEPPAFVRIKVRSEIKVGEILYDSLPGSFILTTWDLNNQMNTSYSQLKPGTNFITVPNAASRYHLHVTQWGRSAELDILRNELDTVNIYRLGGTRAAKKLKSELTYVMVSGSYRAESKNEYQYDGAGRLEKIVYYQKKKDGTPFIALTDQFSYTQRLDKITRFGENGQQLNTTEFFYDANGWVSDMRQRESATTVTEATARYTNANKGFDMEIGYRFHPGGRTMIYKALIRDGNLKQFEATTSNITGETGYYQYDMNINPYIHMNWPDLYLSRQSKNNMILQAKTYTGNFPSADPTKFEYKYDDEGYPIEVIKTWQNPMTGINLYTTKTVFQY